MGIIRKNDVDKVVAVVLDDEVRFALVVLASCLQRARRGRTPLPTRTIVRT